MKKIIIISLLILITICIISIICLISIIGTKRYPDVTITPTPTVIDRLSKIPEGNKKISVDDDVSPPILHSKEWEDPIPLTDIINSSGAEDSPFIFEDTLFFFFTPDVSVPAEKQLLDEVTGIYSSTKSQTGWSLPKRILLTEEDELALDGCEFIGNDKFYFCSAREGYSGINWFYTDYPSFSNLGRYHFDPSYEVGELHIWQDTLFFHSSRPGGIGGIDLWTLENIDGKWQEPKNLSAVNTTGDEGWPYVSDDGNELWFTRIYMGTPAIYRSTRVNDEWQTPELILSQFAGEPTLDEHGNIYFVHHYYKENEMLEADIFISYKKDQE